MAAAVFFLHRMLIAGESCPILVNIDKIANLAHINELNNVERKKSFFAKFAGQGGFAVGKPLKSATYVVPNMMGQTWDKIGTKVGVSCGHATGLRE